MYFTGQKIIIDSENPREVYVECAKCSMPLKMDIAYIDPMLNEQYVHLGCLSAERKRQILEAEQKIKNYNLGENQNVEI